MDAALRPPTSSRRRRGPWERTVTRALRWGILAISLGQFWIGMDTLLSSVRVDSGHVAIGLGLIVVQQGYQISSLWLRQNALMVTAISLALLIGGSGCSRASRATTSWPSGGLSRPFDHASALPCCASAGDGTIMPRSPQICCSTTPIGLARLQVSLSPWVRPWPQRLAALLGWV